MLINKLNYFFVCLLILVLATPVFAVVMTSTSYQIERDSINFAGGLSTSSSYSSESSIGEIGTGSSVSATYVSQSGYQQMETSWVSLSVPSSASLAPAINIVGGGTANAIVDFLVGTNNGTGYTLQMKANTAPALKGSTVDFANYAMAGAIPDYAWSVASADAEFGFTPEGSDIVDRFRDNGAICNQVAGTDASSACWDSVSTTYATIAQSITPNYPTLATTTLRFRAEAGSATTIPIGAYSADMIVTAYTN
jgi:hypothetical protein